MPGFMDSYLPNGQQEDQMFDPYSDMNYMGNEHQGMGTGMPMVSPGQDPRKKNKWAAYFQQMLGRGGQIDPNVEKAQQQQQQAPGGNSNAYRQDPVQAGLNSSMQQGQQLGQGIKKLFG